jgi:hypothetical protein
VTIIIQAPNGKKIKDKSRGDHDRSSKKHENGINGERLVNQLVKAHSSTE